MQIDWFTVVAEIVNFLILIGLLKYFLYDRIINIADQREAKISARFEEAEEKSKKAEKEAESYRAKQEELEERQEQLIMGAKQEAEARRKELLDQARQEVDESRREWQRTLQQEQETFLQELRQRAGHQTVALTRRALADLADAEMEQQMIERFIEQLNRLTEEQRQEITGIIKDGDQNLVITTAFELPQPKRQTLLEAMQQQFGNETEGEFKTSSDLICGIKLKANGHEVAWSLDHYLSGVEEDFARVLEEESRQKHLAGGAEADEV